VAGKITVGSKKWLALVAAAGSAEAVPGYCAQLLQDGNSQG
jgi:hypothetical protein